MADKKQFSVGDARDGLTPEEEQKVEAKVDQMLDVSQPDPRPAAPKAASDAPADGAPPPIDIFSDPKTAPDVPDSVLKTVVPTEEKDSPKKASKTDEKLPDEDEKLLPEHASPDGPNPLEDTKTDKLVDEITSKESDEVLAAEDAKIQKAFEPKKSFKEKIQNFFAAWWGNKKARWGTIIGLIVLLVAVAVWPAGRSFGLNLVGVRASAKVTILDATTDLPLKNAKVQLAGQSATTDNNGNATLKHLKLGSQALTVQKPAFATSSKHVSLSWGTNQLGQVALKAVGAQYHFALTDYVSGKPIKNAEASSGDANAQADDKGNIILTANSNGASTLQVTFSASGYHKQTISVPVGTSTTTNVQMVVAREEVYVSKQSGKYDVYKSDIDGKNKTLLLAGTGNENSQIALVSHPTDEEAALVDTRDNVHDSDGYLEQTLTLINVDTGAPLTVDHSDRIQMVDWIGDRLVYVLIKPGASAANPQRYQIVSYDYQTKQRVALAHANYFNDVVSAGGSIYYASSNTYSGGVSQFVKINPDGTGQQVLLVNEVWNILREDYNDFALSTATGWYTFALGSTKPTSTPNAPSDTTGRVYADSPDGNHSLWIDSRDGKGTLISYDTAAKKDTVIAQQTGLSYPVRWLDNQTVIFRVSSSQETADYVMSLAGGSPKKIADVTDTNGFGRWYYY